MATAPFCTPRPPLHRLYAQRPDTCRLHPQQKSPRPGYCAFGARMQPRKEV